MAHWTNEELELVTSEDNLYISIPNADGSMHAPTFIWIVRAGDDVYTRAYNGPDGRWYSAAKAVGHGHIRVGEMEKDVVFEFPTDDDTNAAVDEGYKTKYAGSQYLPPMLGDKQRAATVKIIPTD